MSFSFMYEFNDDTPFHLAWNMVRGPLLAYLDGHLDDVVDVKVVRASWVRKVVRSPWTHIRIEYDTGTRTFVDVKAIDQSITVGKLVALIEEAYEGLPLEPIRQIRFDQYQAIPHQWASFDALDTAPVET